MIENTDMIYHPTTQNISINVVIRDAVIDNTNKCQSQRYDF